MWLNLSGSLFYFGQGGITRVDPCTGWSDGQKVSKGANLYQGAALITKVDESAEDIKNLLWGIGF